MKESILFCGLMLCALLYVSCEGRQPEKQAWQDVELSPAERHIAERNTAFAFRFFQKATQTDATCVLSPLSASCLLSLLMNGADGDCLAGIRNTRKQQYDDGGPQQPQNRILAFGEECRNGYAEEYAGQQIR